MKKVLLSLMVTIALSLVGISPAMAHLKNVECLAPAGAGGGWDFTCRVPAAQLMPKVAGVEGSIKVINMSGSGGGKAFAHVVSKRNNDERLIVAASAATATRLAQKVYGNYSANDVKWVGALGMDYGVVVVGKNSPYHTLEDLISALKKNPRRTPIVGGSSAGGWDHVKMLLVAKAAGISDLKKINYIAFDNGGKAMLEVISGRAAAFTGYTSEVLGQLQAGKVRVLAVLSNKRVSVLGNVPTAKELGYDVIGGNWRAFYAPAGISGATYASWVAAVMAVAYSDEWVELREKNGLAEFTSFGKDFDDFVTEQIKAVAEISKELGIGK